MTEEDSEFYVNYANFEFEVFVANFTLVEKAIEDEYNRMIGGKENRDLYGISFEASMTVEGDEWRVHVVGQVGVREAKGPEVRESRPANPGGPNRAERRNHGKRK